MKQSPANAPGAPEPVIGVTQVDAAAYCEWVWRRIGPSVPPAEHRRARCPDASHDGDCTSHGDVPDAGFWPHEKGSLPELRGGLKPLFLCEWTREIEEDTVDREPDRVMARIFYPPWLREGNNPLHAHAALLASESYSFVTFRVSYRGISDARSVGRNLLRSRALW